MDQELERRGRVARKRLLVMCEVMRRSTLTCTHICMWLRTRVWVMLTVMFRRYSSTAVTLAQQQLVFITPVTMRMHRRREWPTARPSA